MHTDQYNETARQKINIEETAMKQTNEDIAQLCAKNEKVENIPPNKFMKFELCARNLYRKQVLPVTVYPDLFRHMSAISLENAELYSKGKISNAQLSSRMEIAYVEYWRAVNDRLSQGLQVEQAKDKRLNDFWFGSSNSVDTTCRSTGYSIQCSSW